MVLFLDLLRSVIYGVIEGITEWLPISSTGHMILAEQVLKFSFSAEFMEMFRVVIQLGAILAVVVMYFKKLWPFCVDNGRDSGLAKHVRWPARISRRRKSAGSGTCGSRSSSPACPPPCWVWRWTTGSTHIFITASSSRSC